MDLLSVQSVILLSCVLFNLLINDLFLDPRSLGVIFVGFQVLTLATIAAIARTVGHLNKSAEVMKLVNNLMKAPEVAATMQEFSKEMTKVFF